jgi:indole-3-glycerol phosphate synthase
VLENILEILTESAHQRVAELRKAPPSLSSWQGDSGAAFKAALAKPGVSFICEVKKASPSKGIIAEDFPYVDIARSYQDAGADAISVLTEPYYFKGDNAYLKEISSAVKTPTLRKDFIIDEMQIYEAKELGASAVLLICAIMPKNTDCYSPQLNRFIAIAHSLKMAALVETHNEKEMEMALNSPAEIIGINTRDLRTFQVDLAVTVRLAKMAPDNILLVSESGITSADDVKRVRDYGADAVLVGETLMRSPDKKKMLNELRGAAL